MIPGSHPTQKNREQISEATANPDVRWTTGAGTQSAGVNSGSGAAGALISSILCGTVRFAPQEGQSIARPLSDASHTMRWPHERHVNVISSLTASGLCSPV